MTDQSNKSSRKTLPDSSSAISSPASVDGPTHSDLPGGIQMSLFGQDHAPVNRFRAPASARAKQTNGTCGRNSIVSSRSVALQRSLASRLRQTTDLNGSMEYRLTWKNSITQSQRRICRLQASARH